MHLRAIGVLGTALISAFVIACDGARPKGSEAPAVLGSTFADGGVEAASSTRACGKRSGSSIANTHGAYPAAIIAVGQETGMPVIDMTQRTKAMLESLGPSATIPLFAADDKTHLSAQGAVRVAKLVADGIRALHLPLAERLVP